MERQEERRVVRSVRNQRAQTHGLLCHKTRAGGPKRRALRDLVPACPSREGLVRLHNRRLCTGIPLSASTGAAASQISCAIRSHGHALWTLFAVAIAAASR